jgi:hypothetical protein
VPVVAPGVPVIRINPIVSHDVENSPRIVAASVSRANTAKIAATPSSGNTKLAMISPTSLPWVTGT